MWSKVIEAGIFSAKVLAVVGTAKAAAYVGGKTYGVVKNYLTSRNTATEGGEAAPEGAE